MSLVFQAVLVILATAVSTLVESTDLPPVPEDSNDTATLEGSEPLHPEPYELEPTAILPHERAYGQPRTVYKDIRYVTKTEYVCPKTVTCSPTEVPTETPNQTPDYCNSNGMFLHKPTNECFKYLNDRLRSFEDADAQCRKEGMRLAKPKNPKGIQEHLVTVLGYSGHIYIGARGDGQSFKWQRDGETISNTDSKWWIGMPLNYVTTDRCLVLVAKQHGVKKGTVYYPESCSVKLSALCQREECSPQCTMGTCTGPNTCCYDPRSEAVCPDGCGNGQCTGPNNCTCSDGYTGNNCDKPVCPDGCGNGQCTGPNECTCSDGYEGNTCDKQTCDGAGMFMVGSQCFRIFKDEEVKWDAAKQKCSDAGMALAEPTDDEAAVLLRKVMVEKFGDVQPWLGGRGNGNAMVFQRSGRIVPRDSSYIDGIGGGGGSMGNNQCLELDAVQSELDINPGGPYDVRSCTAHSRYALCEVI